jgi:L-threonylcarbamoyladenylate synthase
MPSHPVALEVIRRAGVPVAAPSANNFGHTSPTTARHVLDDLDGRIDAVLDAGATEHGLESTVLDPGQHPMMIYRPGAITSLQIRRIAGAVELYSSATPLTAQPREALPSPGVGLRHYAPHATLVLVEAPLDQIGTRLAQAAQDHTGARIGVMLPDEVASPLPHAIVFPWGRWAVPEELAHQLFAGLRSLDEQGCTVILCPLPHAEGIGAAIRDRLRKAATPA